MKNETIEFIKVLFEGYRDSSSGKEPDNALELRKAWDDLEAYVARRGVEARIVEDIYAEFRKEEVIGLWDLGARVCEILVEHKYNKS